MYIRGKAFNQSLSHDAQKHCVMRASYLTSASLHFTLLFVSYISALLDYGRIFFVFKTIIARTMICILCSIASSYWTLGAVALVYAVYRWGTATFDHFARRGIAFVRPWPLVGNFEGIVSRKRTFHDFVLDGYNAYANEP